MLVVALCVLALLSPLVAGRWPAGLLLHRWRWPLLIWAVLILQAVVVGVSMNVALASVLHVVTYIAAVAFLWLNRSVGGVWIVAAGAVSNGVVIALNGGTLPASAAAVEAAGLQPGDGFLNSAVLENPILPWLGDVFAWPAPMPLANTVSIGDILIVIGVVVAAWTGTAKLGATRTAAVAEDV